MTSSNTNRRQPWVLAAICLALGIAAFCLYWPVRTHSFVLLDDADYVTANPYVRAGITSEGIRWALTQSHSSNWHPLTWISHMLDCQIFGPDPGKHHLVNVGFHVANTLLLFLILQGLTRARWESAFVAALFALHPLHVESVAWVAERKDVLSTLFFLLTIWAYSRFARSTAGGVMRHAGPSLSGTRTEPGKPLPAGRALRFYLLALALFTLGLMSKPMLVTLPFVLLLLDYWPLGRVSGGPVKTQIRVVLKLALEKIPFFALSALSCAATVWAQNRGQAIASFELLPLSYRISNSLADYLRYFEKMVWPEKLSVFYPFKVELPIDETVIAVLFVGVVSIVAVIMRNRRPYLLVGWFWYLGTLIPVLGLVQVGAQAMADRYTYIPLLGLFIALAWLAADLSLRLRYRAVWLCVTAAAILIACASQSASQIGYWLNNRTLFEHATVATERNFVAWTALGDSFEREGKHDKAIECLTKAIEYSPNYPLAWLVRGACLAAQGLRDQAQADYLAAVRLDPNNADIRNGYGVFLAAQGQLDQAEAQLREAHRLSPNFEEAWLNLASVLERLGRMEDGANECRGILALDPGSSEAHYHLANALARLGRVDEAIAHYRDSLRLQPNSSESRVSLGLSLVEKRDFAQAVKEFSTVLQTDPKSASAVDGLGYALAMQGKVEESTSNFLAAVKLDPRYANAHLHLALNLAGQRQFREAITEYRAALRLDGTITVALNNLAWLLASCSEAELRSGREAVELAERACQQTGYQEPFFVGTLAAAYAENKQFDKAVTAAEQARDLAKTKGLTAVVARNEQLLELYRARQPYHEPAAEGPNK